jgi:hypothetical protein
MRFSVLANSGGAQTAWRTVAPTPHTATVHRRVPRDKTDNNHLHQSKNALEPYNKSTRPKAGDVTAFFCHFLGDHGDNPEKVLKKAGLEGDDWEDPDSVPALYKASTQFLPSRFAMTAILILTPMTMPPGLLLTLMIASGFLFEFVGSRVCFPFSLCFLWLHPRRARHSQPLFATKTRVLKPAILR